MEIRIRAYQTEDTQAILDIINYNILHSTALYDYNIRNYEQQQAILEDKTNKGFPVLVAELNEELVGFVCIANFDFEKRTSLQWNIPFMFLKSTLEKA